MTSHLPPPPPPDEGFLSLVPPPPDSNPSLDALPSSSENPLDLKKLAWTFGLGLLALIVLLGLLGTLFYHPLLALSRSFVQRFGGWGVAIGFFLPDAVALPLPNDAFTFLGLKGGLSFWTVVFWATGGSILGGSVGYFIGLTFRRARWFKRIIRDQGAETFALARKYGLLALALGALTPLPYSFTCWASGAIQIPFWHFLLVSTLRLPRIAFYLWLIQVGFLKMSFLG